jgi:hypothetical protein
LKVFIKARCQFSNPSQNELDLLEMGVGVSETCVIDWIVIDLDQVSDFNQSTGGFTTVNLKNGSRFIIDVQFDAFSKIIEKNVGTILQA